jgi:hypothetical protein
VFLGVQKAYVGSGTAARPAEEERPFCEDARDFELFEQVLTAVVVRKGTQKTELEQMNMLSRFSVQLVGLHV